MMITVTGATGRLGRLVVEGLLARVPASQIIAVVRDPAKADFAERGVNVRVADYERPESLPAALDGTDRLLLISTNLPARAIAQHAAVTDAARQVGVGLLAYTSLVLESGPPRSTEPIIRASGLPFTFLRNNQYTDHYAPQIRKAVTDGVLVGSAGNGRAATATHADYAAAAVAVLTGEGHEGMVYELSGDTAWSLPELAAELTKANGSEIGCRDVSFEEHLKLLTASGVPRYVAEVFVANYRAMAAGAFAATPGDLRRLIGRPTTTLAESVAEILSVPPGPRQSRVVSG